ncbi:MAG TPA: TIGR02757 family protein [Thermoanaerobaculia bacterium]
MRALSNQELLLRDRLEGLYRAYGRETAESDPIVFPLRYPEPEDREVAAWIASAFAYGRVATIQNNVGRILSALGSRPAATLDRIADHRGFARDHWNRFRHRFHSWRDAALLTYVIGQARQLSGSVAAFFEAEFREEERDVQGLLSRVVRKILDLDYRPVLSRRRMTVGSPARFLFPDPADGSACKRWNLFLRWMVRRDDLDFGLWRTIPTDRLVIPTDTHIHLVSRRLGLTRRKSADWKTAREITDRLARFDASDPVRFDYALCRIGIFGICRRDLQRSLCGECFAAGACPASRRRKDRKLVVRQENWEERPASRNDQTMIQ